MVRFGRRIAFDYGDVRIGVAICDPDGLIATPLSALASKDPGLAKAIALLIAEYKPVKVYVGEPKQLNGTSAIATEKVKLFTDLLTQRFDIKVALIDERLSTVSAARALREAGVKAKEAKLFIDSMAAVAILEQGLAIDRI